MRLPYVDFVVAALVGGVLAIYFRIGRRMPLIHLLAATLCFFASNVALFWWMAKFTQSAWLYPVVYVWVGIFGVLATSQVWTLTNYVLTGREAKRLVGFIGTGGIVGGIVRRFSVQHCVAIDGRGRTVSGDGRFDRDIYRAGLCDCRGMNVLLPALSNAPAIKSQRSATLRESFSLVISSPHLLPIAALICICSIATYIAGWQFRAIVKETLPDKDAMAAFLGTFYGDDGCVGDADSGPPDPQAVAALRHWCGSVDPAACPDCRDDCDYRIRRNVGGDISARDRQSRPVLGRQRGAAVAVSTCSA